MFESGNIKIFSYKCIVIASLHYVISAWEWFNGNAMFSDSGEYVYMIIHLKICSKSRNLIQNILALKEKKNLPDEETETSWN